MKTRTEQSYRAFDFATGETPAAVRVINDDGFFFFDEVAPFTDKMFRKILAMIRDEEAAIHEREYRRHFYKLPGSLKTKRLRKKRRSIIAKWMLFST